MVKETNFEKTTNSTINFIKQNLSPYLIIIRNDKNEAIAYLEAITTYNGFSKEVIKDLKIWREENQQFFPSQFKVTLKGTKLWVKNQLIDKKDRLLFFVKDTNGKRIGHLGLYRFDYNKKNCEIDNVIRGRKDLPGIMTFALNALVKWTYKEFDVKEILLTVFADNSRAIKLYKRSDFVNYKFIPLKKEISNATINWIEIPKRSSEKPERQYLVMKHKTTT